MEISVIIANYNYASLIPRCIRSVRNQSFNNMEMEIIVVDDCSTDNSRQIIESFPEITKIFNEKNKGLVKSINEAVRIANGKFTYFVDADDYISKNALLVCHDFISHNKNEMDAVSTDYYEVSDKEIVIKRRDGMAYPIRCGSMYYTDHLIELGPYNDVKREDIDFRNRFVQSGKYIYNIKLPYYRYTQHSGSLTKNQ